MTDHKNCPEHLTRKNASTMTAFTPVQIEKFMKLYDQLSSEFEPLDLFAMFAVGLNFHGVQSLKWVNLVEQHLLSQILHPK